MSESGTEQSTAAPPVERRGTTADSGPPTSSPPIPQTASSLEPPPATLWQRIKRHKLVEWAIAYVAFGYATLHGVEMLREAFGWPVIASRLTVFVLLLGFPVAVTLAWYHGHKARQRISGPELLIVSLLLALGGSVLWGFSRSREHHAEVASTPRQPAVAEKSIAVLPFADLSERHDQEYFADGMAEEVIGLLARIPELKVIGRTSSFQFKGKNQDLRAVGSALGVNYVVEGSVRRSDDQLRVTAQLISAQDGSHLWSDTYDVPVGNVLNIQDQIASNLVRALQVSVGAGDLTERPSFKSAEAYDLYLRGIHSFDRLDKEGFASAAVYFQQVLDVDPDSAPAADWFALTQIYLVYYGYVEPRDGLERARQAAQRTLALNPKSSMAYQVLGNVHWIGWDWAAAERDAKESLRLNPSNPDAMYLLGQIYLTLGRWDESAGLIDRAISLDPFRADFHNYLGLTLSAAGRLSGAETELRKTFQISPTLAFGHLDLGSALLMEGKLEAALAEMQKEQLDVARDFGLAVVYDTMQRRAESDAALAQLIQKHAPNAAYFIAIVYARRQKMDQAFDWIERAYRQRDPEFRLIKYWQVYPGLERFVHDPRFTSLLREMNLPE